MSTTSTAPAEPGPEPLDRAGLATRQPAAADLARTAAQRASDLLAPSAPVRLGDVVPAPEQVTPDPTADYLLPEDAGIRVSLDPAARDVAEQLAGWLRPATGYPLPVADAADATPGGPLTLTLADSATHPAGAPSATATAAGGAPLAGPAGSGSEAGAGLPGGGDLGDEGYLLEVSRDGIRITAAAPAGLFHGAQTLRQLLPVAVEHPTPVTERWVVPGGTIVDRPRFAYRGAMLDVARHFFGVEDVLRVVDHLARYKLNHLHLHLTDDQGWRIAVDSWPRLAEVGGATQVGGGPGGWYTKDDYRRIVSYAARRHVTVVPEIDLPGHTNAALVAYPELAPGKIPPPPYTGTEVGFSYVDPADERTYDFVADVVGEVAALTPGPWLHLGGDEAFKVKGVAYTGFVERAQRIVADAGKTVIGWHQLAPAEHLHGRVLQWWGTNGEDPETAEAVRRGARVILSPGNRAYLDMKYAPDTPIGHDWAGLIDVRRAYDWDPGSHIDGVPVEAVLGVEAPLWTESVTTLAEVEFMLFPRLPAVAELGWSPRSTHDWAAFRERLAGHGPRWTAAGITFHPAPDVPWPAPHPIPTQRTTTPADTH
ncbi:MULTISPECIES: family 20 glycosylhydrolase [Micromonospora]|uniref:beta-N-acetylhexosaminidase n=1 Tax=Micromonospora solifontis TaxID=2487138 RepID=A0ABX9WBJ2_9ACTN|nr:MULTISPECIES: family 20 glycosylhydrolase [Micromonospora]NES16614.1 family 20 glycosylhydrolase [Micromonospora sp. PPF5-17B]NES39235.1 family 20 glycosylhydrolase [Micromonospora solifontis]NES58393.1 family 20 glycosylhydrolase [Micromonospora sp. PPF5-6]RNL89821.1 beta-N-acetylhexosaminidase [Micromonospora solifontis]